MIKVNNIEIKPTIFPDNCSQVWQLPRKIILQHFVQIEWFFEDERELIQLGQLTDLLKNYNIGYSLYIPYLPYGRQDKEISNDKTFGLHTFVNIISNFGVDKITTLDVHNNIYPHIINNIEPINEINYVISEVNPTVIIFPDEGAERRYKHLLHSFKTVTIKKVREQSTGKILSLTLPDNHGIKNDDVLLMIDDICCGGGTFIGIANLLNGFNLNLYTTHGIYSKGTKVIFDSAINRIFNYKGEVKK